MYLNTPEFKVGALVIIVSALIGVMSLKVAEGPGMFTSSKRFHFDLDDANGLVKNSAVKIAGIKVGVIEDITLSNGKARVALLINGEVPVKVSTQAKIQADGILGDKHVELTPGLPSENDLATGSEITAGPQRGSLDQVMNEVGKISDSLGQLAETLNNAATGKGDTSTPIGRIIKNLENLTQDLADVSGKNKGKLNDIVDRVHSITTQMDNFLGDEGAEGFSASWEKMVSSLSRIDTSLKNVEEITHKINSGEGTLGRLVNDEETIDGINQAVYNVNEFLGGAGEMETSVDFHSEYLNSPDLFKSYLSVRIQPGLDRYYEFGIVDSREGVTEEKDTTTTSGGSSSNTNTRTTYRNRVKITALFAKNFYDFTVRGGILENAGGIGFDYHLFQRRLQLSLEAFEFQDLHLKAFAKYTPFKGIYLIGGGDNMLDKDQNSAFIGAGIFITNDDLKMLASKVSF